MADIRERAFRRLSIGLVSTQDGQSHANNANEYERLAHIGVVTAVGSKWLNRRAQDAPRCDGGSAASAAAGSAHPLARSPKNADVKGASRGPQSRTFRRACPFSGSGATLGFYRRRVKRPSRTFGRRRPAAFVGARLTMGWKMFATV